MSSVHDLCVVIADLGAGGAQRVCAELVNTWTGDGLRVCVVTMTSASEDFVRIDPAISRLSIGPPRETRSLVGAIFSNARYVRKLRRAIVHSGSPRVLSFVGTMNVLAILACRGLSVHLTISERNDPTRQRLGRPWDRMRRILYSRANLVTANSRSAIEALAVFVPRHKLACLPNPVREPGGDSTAPRKRPFVLNIGRLTAQKAQDVLIDGFARFAHKNPDWDLAIIGEGPLNSALTQQADQLGLARRIKFIGRIDDPFPYYRAAAIFALPSRHEGLPNVLLEAMTCGVASIVCDTTGGALEYVTDGISGLVIPGDNADALCKALMRLAAAPALRRRLGEAGQERVSHLTGPEVSETWKRALGLAATAK